MVVSQERSLLSKVAPDILPASIADPHYEEIGKGYNGNTSNVV